MLYEVGHVICNGKTIVVEVRQENGYFYINTYFKHTPQFIFKVERLSKREALHRKLDIVEFEDKYEIYQELLKLNQC